jgi:hypothetical protein
MRAALGPCLALSLFACSQADEGRSIPRAEDVERLEAKVASHPCVGDLNGWERNYRFAHKRHMFWPESDYPDFDIIEFHFRRARTITIAPARNLIRTSEGRDWVDSASIQTIDGSFRVTTGELHMRRCKPLRSN